MIFKLDTGETITVREFHNARYAEDKYEALVVIHGLSSAPDHHALGATEEEAAHRLQEYVQYLRHKQRPSLLLPPLCA